MGVVFVVVVVVVDQAIQRCKGEESLRSATGHSVTQRSVHRCSSIPVSEYFLFLLPKVCQTSCQHILRPSPKNCAEKLRQKGAQSVPSTAGIEAAHSIRLSCISNTTPPPTSSLDDDTTDATFRLADNHRLRRTPTHLPLKKEGVPIVRISKFDLSSTLIS